MANIKTSNITVTHKNSMTPLVFPDLSIGTKDRILLLGESGCGKTTLLSVLAGFLKPTTGQVMVGEQDFYKLPTRERDKLRGNSFGFVFQTLHLIPSITIVQNILLAASMSDTPPDKNRLNHLLQSLGLQDKSHRKPAELSQGEQQRAALARAVFNSPSLIIADEPTSSLDDKNANIVMDILEHQCAESGSSLLVATHDHRIKDRFKTIITLTPHLQEKSVS